MANISGASMGDIYDRLSGIQNYHPLDANTFSDWSMEAGDIVKVTRGGTEYESPIHSTKLVWKGAPQMTISSTGNKERDSIAKTSRKKYGRGGTAVRNEEKIYRTFTSSDGLLWSAIYMTESVLYTHFDNAISDVHSMILQTADQIYSTVYASDSQLYSYVNMTATYIQQGVASTESRLGSTIRQTAESIMSEVHAADSQVYSYVRQTASNIRSEVANTVSGLQSSIEQTADKVDIIVEGTGTNIHIKPAQIQAGIDAATGSSKIVLSANNIVLDGDAVASSLTGKYVGFGNGKVEGQLEVDRQLYVEGNIICEQNLNVSTIEDHAVGNFIVSAVVNNNTNTVTFTNLAGSSWDFSKAASVESLTGEWRGTVFTVTTVPSSEATYTIGFPSGSSYPYKENLFIDWDSSHSLSASGTNITVPMKAVVRNSAGAGTKVSPDTYVTIANALDNSYATSSVAITENGTYEPASGKVGFNKIIVDVPGGGTPVDYRLFPVWDSNQHNKLTVTRTENQQYGTTYTTYVIATMDDITYNSTTHKYHTTAYAKADTNVTPTTVRYTTDPKYSGTEAYEDGWHDCNETVGIRRAGSVSSGSLMPGQSTYFYAISSATPGAAQTDKAGSGVSAATDSNLVAGNIKNGVTIFGVTGTYNPTVTIGSWQLNYQANTNYTYKAKVQVNGTWYESGNLSATNAYDNGWSACTGSVGISPNTEQTINPGGDIIVYAQAKASSGAPSPTNYASVKIKAAAVSLSNWSLAYQSGTDSTYKASVKVNGTTYTSGNITAPDAYANGQAAAGLVGAWDGATLTVDRVLSGSTKTLTYAVTAASSLSYDSSTHKYTATGTAKVNGTTRATKTATSGLEAFYAGKASVTLNDPTYSSVTSVGTSRTITVSTSGRTNESGTADNLSKTIKLYLTANSGTINLRTSSTSGTIIAKRTDSDLKAANIKKDVEIYGVTGTFDKYADGIDIVPYLASSSGANYSNRTLTVTSNGTYYAKAATRSAVGAGYDKFVLGNTITVNVSAPTPTVSFGSDIGKFSTKQTSGINKDYSAPPGYKYLVVSVTVNGTTYKAQIYVMSS